MPPTFLRLPAPPGPYKTRRTCSVESACALNTVLLLIHLFVTIALIGVILIQRSEGGGLRSSTAQGMGSFMTGRGTANLLTRTTAIPAMVFFALSLALAQISRGKPVVS